MCAPQAFLPLVSAMKWAIPSFRQLPADFWVRISQIFVGLFFLGAAFYKLQNYFLVGDQSLTAHFEFWIRNGWPPQWYVSVMRQMLRYENFFEAATIALQTIPAALLILNRKVHLAGMILLLVQLNIFLGTFHHRHFNEFVGISLWLALFFFLKPEFGHSWNPRTWNILRLMLILLLSLQLWNRYLLGDPWPSEMTWQREHLAADVLSVSLAWKWLALSLGASSFGTLLWASVWWLKVACTVFLLTPWRRVSSTTLLVIALFQSWTWMNSLTSQGVLWILVLFVFAAQEYAHIRLKKANIKTSSD
jgi:hypothetical protein